MKIVSVRAGESFEAYPGASVRLLETRLVPVGAGTATVLVYVLAVEEVGDAPEKPGASS